MTTWEEQFVRQPAAEPRLELLETCWQLRTPRGRILYCGIYQTDTPGFEVRAGFSEEDLIRSQRTAEIGSARESASAWRKAVIGKGGFTDDVAAADQNHRST
jgi:hypothetical protein